MKDHLLSFSKLMPVVAVVVGIFGLGVQLDSVFGSVDFNLADVLFAISTIMAASIVGVYSSSIARKGRELSKIKRVFLSYSYDSKAEARLLAKALTARGMKVWFDENDLQPGDELRSAISSAIESSNAVIALVSNHVGSHARSELQAAKARQVPVYAFVKPDIALDRLDDWKAYVKSTRSSNNVEEMADMVVNSVGNPKLEG